ncbi:hypothetical protein JTE90_019138 [Oedothorax gibbosus]|uniref:Uncharacterized protein n=1 Tax=Oedothorax gibbosus TaxID=931172 RepID=A0AAV6U388_9ARAC|nr:hypothetical protein JTE90_019138 [Oedothorax gibbosus]
MRPYPPNAQYGFNWSPPAQSNETTNGYFLERSQTARMTLAKAFELCPDEDIEDAEVSEEEDPQQQTTPNEANKQNSETWQQEPSVPSHPSPPSPSSSPPSSQQPMNPLVLPISSYSGTADGKQKTDIIYFDKNFMLDKKQVGVEVSDKHGFEIRDKQRRVDFYKTGGYKFTTIGTEPDALCEELARHLKEADERRKLDKNEEQ